MNEYLLGSNWKPKLRKTGLPLEFELGSVNSKALASSLYSAEEPNDSSEQRRIGADRGRSSCQAGCHEFSRRTKDGVRKPLGRVRLDWELGEAG